MRVLFVLDSLGAGGAERSTALMLPALRDRGAECAVAVLRHDAEGFEAEVTGSGFTVFRVGGNSAVHQVRALRRVLDGYGPQIVHTAVYAADQIGRLASIGAKSRVVSSLISMPRTPEFRSDGDPATWKTAVVNALDRATGRLFVDIFHAVTPGVADAYSRAYRIPQRKIAVVERGRPLEALGRRTAHRRADVRRHLGFADDDELVIAVGRHERQKAHVVLIEAAGRLMLGRPNLHLIVAGRQGEATPAIHAAVDSLGDAGVRVHLLGHRADVPDLLAASDVFALPSQHEGTAGAALEAMALGLPIVSSDLQGMKGIIEHERNCLVVPPGAVGPLASSIERLLDDTALGGKLAAEAQADFVERFTIERAADRTIEMYEAVLSRH